MADAAYVCGYVLRYSDRTEGQELQRGSREECDRLAGLVPAVAVSTAEVPEASMCVMPADEWDALWRKMYLNLDAFYAADLERKRSGEVDFGVMWVDGDRTWPQYRVSWVERTGEFYAVRLHPGDGGPVEVLGIASDRATAEEMMDGWAYVEGPSRLDWVRERLRPTP